MEFEALTVKCYMQGCIDRAGGATLVFLNSRGDWRNDQIHDPRCWLASLDLTEAREDDFVVVDDQTATRRHIRYDHVDGLYWHCQANTPARLFVLLTQQDLEDSIA